MQIKQNVPLAEFSNVVRSELERLANFLNPDEHSSNSGSNSASRDSNMRDNGMRINVGIVQDTDPKMNAYRVGVPNGGIYICHALTLSGGTVCTLPKYAPGDAVVLCGNTNSSIGYILGAISPLERFGDSEPRTFITVSDSPKENVFSHPVSQLNTKDPEMEVQCRTYMSPMNNLDTGSFSIGSMAGPKFFTDPFMAFLSCNDATGVWAFRDNSMLRVAGLNYQKLTSGTYAEQFNDNGELNGYSGEALNSWEPLGYYKKPGQVTKEENEWYSKSTPTYQFEPKEEDLRPFYRRQSFNGWIGQGKQSHTIAPAEKDYSKETEKESDQLSLSRISQAANGFIGIESVKGISIVKQAVMPAVQKLREAFNESSGDCKENGYDFSHSNFHPTDEPELSDKEPNQTAMAIEDYCAYVMNYRNLSALIEHVKDWYVPEVKGLGKDAYDLESVIRSVAGGKPLPLPTEYAIKIDDIKHRYYPISAGIHLTPEGGVVIYDGYGSELRMAGGSITISAPGGIWLKSGRNVHLWAGNDLNLRARKSIDETTSEGSIRIKAERNLEMLGGNEGGSSGVIIESRGHGSMNFDAGGDGISVGGIVIRSPEGTVSTMAHTVYVRSGIDGPGGGIFLDAQDGRGNIYTYSDSKIDYLKNNHAYVFGDIRADTVEETYLTTRNKFYAPGSIECDKNVIAVGNIYADGNCMLGGNVLSKGAASGNTKVNPLIGEGRVAFDSIIQTTHTTIDTVNPGVQTTVALAVDEQFYWQSQPGNPDVLKTAQFSFRTDQELGLNDFRVYEDRWQTLCTSAGDGWHEPKVSTATEKGEYPFPGKKYLKDENCLVSQELTLVSNGLPVNRKKDGELIDKYKNPEYKKQEHKPLDKYRTL